MSDYKLVNGKKVRVCKFGCDTELVWSDDISGFIETKGGLTHTQDRCKQVKESKQGAEIIHVTKQETTTYTLDAVVKKLASIGVELDLEALMKQ